MDVTLQPFDVSQALPRVNDMENVLIGSQYYTPKPEPLGSPQICFPFPVASQQMASVRSQKPLGFLSSATL